MLLFATFEAVGLKMLQLQKELRTMNGPPDAAWRLGDALKNGVFSAWSRDEKPRRAFLAPTIYLLSRFSAQFLAQVLGGMCRYLP
jgi:hypothetical protein